jgi:hypothetical protein
MNTHTHSNTEDDQAQSVNSAEVEKLCSNQEGGLGKKKQSPDRRQGSAKMMKAVDMEDPGT